MRWARRFQVVVAAIVALSASWGAAGEDWPQFKFDGRQSGNVPQRTLAKNLGLLGAVPLGDSIFTAPVVGGGNVYVLDGSGTAWCIRADTLEVVWKFATPGGKANCNNLSSPALVDGKLHFGTMVGRYWVLDATTGKAIRQLACGDPILGSPVVAGGRVYFTTLGSRVYALKPDGNVVWTWDFLKEVVQFSGDRWNGADWLRHKGGRVDWHDQFCATIGLAVHGKRIALPAGGRLVWLDDAGDRAKLVEVGVVPNFAGSEYPAPFGLSLGEDGTTYLQWHRRDNAGRVEILRPASGKAPAQFVPGTQTAINLHGLLSFSSVSMRGQDVYRCRPEEGFGFCRHSPGQEQPQYLGGYPSICPPVLLRDVGVYGGLDGAVYVAPLDGRGRVWSFRTAFGRAITAPVAVCDGRIYAACEDGYLYVLGPGGRAPLPTTDLELCAIRSPLTGKWADAKYDWFTNYGDLANTNANSQGFRPPVRMKWVRRYEGTFKHLPTFGGGRMYTHTSEGQVFAVEQETGRLLWRRYWPGVYLSFTAPLYYQERLLLPQAGMKQSRLRCLDAATGKLLWEAPFTGSPSWSRQGPPVVYKNLAIYGFGTGRYDAQGTDKFYVQQGKPQPSPDGAEVMAWIYGHNNPYYPKDNLPILRAWDLDTGRVVWEKNFSEYGTGGNDCGVCLMDGTLYYSTFFGYAATRRGAPGPKGLTAASGIDAVTHDLEAYASMLATDYTDGPALRSLKMIFEYLPRAYDNGQNDPVAREKMGNAATMAGMAFANAFLGVCHSMAHKLGAFHHLPHGIANALMIDEVLRFNAVEVPVKMGTFSQYDHPHTLARYAEVADYLGLKGKTDADKLEALIAALDELKAKVGIKKTIRDYGIDEADFLYHLDAMTEQAFDDQCTGANPRYPLMSEIKQMYLNAYYVTHETV